MSFNCLFQNHFWSCLSWSESLRCHFEAHVEGGSFYNFWWGEVLGWAGGKPAGKRHHRASRVCASTWENAPGVLVTVPGCSWHFAQKRWVTLRFSDDWKLPWWLSWWRILLQHWCPGFDPWVGKIPWRRERLPTPVFWPGEFHGLYMSRVAKSQTQLSDFHFGWKLVKANELSLQWSLSYFVWINKVPFGVLMSWHHQGVLVAF